MQAGMRRRSARESLNNAGAAVIPLRFQDTRLSVLISDPEMEKQVRESFRFMLAADDPSIEHSWRDETLDLVTEHPIRPELLQFIHNAVFRRFIALRPDLMWIHAGAVEKDGSAILIAGASGQGKSTLTGMLCRAGFSYMSDDVAPIDMSTDTVYPFPQTPRRRAPSTRPLDPGEVQALERTVISLNPDVIRKKPAPIRRIFFLDYQAGAQPDLSPLTCGEAALGIIGSLTNFLDHREAAVDRSVALARSIPAFRLIFDHRSDSVATLIAET